MGESESRGPSHGASHSAAIKQIRVGEDNPPSNMVSCSPNQSAQQTMSVPASSHSSPESVGDESSTPPQSPLDLLFSDSDPEGNGVKQIHITDSGSRSQIDIQGVPADRIIDTAADITIMGGKLFALVAALVAPQTNSASLKVSVDN